MIRKKWLAVLLCACLLLAALPVAAAAETRPNGISMQPATVLRVDSAEDFTQDQMNRASNVFANVDGQLNVTALGGAALGTFAEFYDECYMRAVYPVVGLTEGQEDAFIAYAQEHDIWDITVVGSAATVKKVRTALPETRAALDLRGAEDLSDYAAVVTQTNGNLARIALIDAEDASRGLVEYVQARFVTVWADAATEEEMFRAVFSGAYGVLTADPERANDAYKAAGTDGDLLVRTPYLFGHRGVSGDSSVTENSIGAFRKAADAGATHLEMDLKLTADQEIVILHDDSLNTTSTGTGLAVASLTLEQLRQHKLKDGQDIPTLADVLEEFRDDPVILMLEFKTDAEELPNLVRAELKEYDMLDRCVIISFYTEQLAAASTILPECPTLNLSGMSTTRISAAIRVLCQYNTGWGLGYDDCTYEILTESFRDRGFIAYGGVGSVGFNGAYGDSLGGIMYDTPSAVSGLPRSLDAEAAYTVPVGGETTLTATLRRYVGQESVQCGFIVLSGSLAAAGDTATAVLTYTEETSAGTYTYLSEAVTLTASGEAGGQPSGDPGTDPDASGGCGGCNGSAAASSLLLGAAAAAGAIVLLFKRAGRRL